MFSFYFPWKHQMFSGVFRGYKMGRLHKNRISKSFLLNKKSFTLANEKMYFIEDSILEVVFTFTTEIFNRKLHFLTFLCITSQNGQTHFKNLAAKPARFVTCVWQFWGVIQ